MDKKFIVLGVAVVFFVSLIAYNLYSVNTIGQTAVRINLPKINKTASNQQTSQENPPTGQTAPGPFAAPLDRAGERITKKPFGLFITPQNSPVQPERFRGWHTGADFEIFPEELNADVQVRAICDGKLLAARTAGGYGGVAVESCMLNNQSVTVIYGHLNIASVKFKTGDQIKAGDVIASLGADKSVQTDGERKHLHLGIHKGSSVNIPGYVQKQSDLSQWIDPCSIKPVCE